MDFLDPKKFRQHQITLLVGYLFVATAIAFGTIILLYQAYGFGFGKDGQVIQNGLVYLSSQPSGAQIYTNGTLSSSNTNTRLLLPSGRYEVKISKTGYRDWQRQINVNGGDVQHFDYPFLFPQNLQTKPLAALTSAPDVMTGSPDHRWILLERGDDKASFDLYDLKKPTAPIVTTITIPASVYTPGDGPQSWAAVGWASDNRHLLLLHSYTAAGQPAHEYIILDRQTPESSINVTQALNLQPSKSLSLYNGKYNQYFVFDKTAGTLDVTSLDNSVTPRSLTHIIAFTAHADNAILYITDLPPSGSIEPGKVSVVLQQGTKTYTLHTLDANAPSYLLSMAAYQGSWYVLAGATNGKGVYLYKDVQAQSSDNPSDLPKPWRFLQVNNPSFVGFSTTAQFVTVENDNQFMVYDTEDVRTYSYTTKQPLDAPQTHATWMDGDRLLYVSGGKLVVFDYDNQNTQILQPADPAYIAVFDAGYSHIYNIAPNTDPDTPLSLTTTPLTITKP